MMQSTKLYPRFVTRNPGIQENRGSYASAATNEQHNVLKGEFQTQTQKFGTSRDLLLGAERGRVWRILVTS